MMENKELDKVKIGDKIEINGQTYTVQNVEYHPKEKDDEWHTDTLVIDLEDNHVLQKEWGEWKFFQFITKKGWFGSITTRAKYAPINQIKIV